MLSRLKGWLGLASEENTGAWGESCASAWLEKERGFRIVARNWRSPQDRRDELDLVGLDGSVLVFVEVKTRSESARVSGYHAIDRRKRAVLRRACDAYLRGLSPVHRPATFRFDVMEVSRGFGGAPPGISHFENVPLFRKFYRR